MYSRQSVSPEFMANEKDCTNVATKNNTYSIQGTPETRRIPQAHTQRPKQKKKATRGTLLSVVLKVPCKNSTQL